MAENPVYTYSKSVAYGEYQYRLVKPNSKKKVSDSFDLPIRPGRILSEDQWQNELKIQQSLEWEHIGYIHDSLLFRRKGKLEEKLDEGIMIPLTKSEIKEPYQIRYEYLRCLSEKYPVMYNIGDIFGDRKKSIDNHPSLSINTRGLILNWILDKLNQFDLVSCFSEATYIFDLFLSNSVNISKAQLFGAVCAFLACKIESGSSTKLVSDWVELINNTEDEFLQAESSIISILNFSFILPHVSRFVQSLLQEYNIDNKDEKNLIDFLVHISLIYGVFPKYKSYTVAEACVGLVVLNPNFIHSDPLYNNCIIDIAQVFDLALANTKTIEAPLRIYSRKRRFHGQAPLTKDVISIKPSNCCRKIDLGKCDPIKPIKNSINYIEEDKLGEGAYGIVSKVSDEKDPLKKYAHKQSKKFNYKIVGVFPTTIIETAIMREFNHPNVVSIINPRLSDGQVSYYMDLMSPFAKILNSHKLTIDEVKLFTRQLLSGIEYIHNRDIIHRDLKPDNILIDEKTNQLKITDFGMAIWVSTDTPQEYDTDVGSLWYNPPELLLHGKNIYNKSFDMWSIGCIIGKMVNGYTLFMANNPAELLLQIGKYSHLPDILKDDFITRHPVFSVKAIKEILASRSAEWNTPENKENLDNVCDLIGRLLTLDPKYRLSAKKALEHSFVNTIEYQETPDGKYRLLSKETEARVVLTIKKHVIDWKKSKFIPLKEFNHEDLFAYPVELLGLHAHHSPSGMVRRMMCQLLLKLVKEGKIKEDDNIILKSGGDVKGDTTALIQMYSRMSFRVIASLDPEDLVRLKNGQQIKESLMMMTSVSNLLGWCRDRKMLE